MQEDPQPSSAVTPPPAAAVHEDGVGRWVRLYLPRWYLQRFPLALGAFLLGYVPFALFMLPTVFRTTLVLTTRGLGWVTLFTVVAAVVVMATRRTVLLYGPARFNIPWPASDAPLSAWQVTAHLSLAAPIVIIAAWLSATDGEIGFRWAAVAVVAGAAGAVVFTVVASFIHAYLVAPSQELPDLVLPSSQMVFAGVHQQEIRGTWLGALVRRLGARLRPVLGPGYVSSAGELLPAHLYAVGIFLAFGLFYGGAYFLGHPRQAHEVPALVFVLILITFAIIVLSGVAFFLDRHHLPTLLPIAVWVAVLSWVSASDHYFALHPSAPLAPLSPSDIAKTHERLLTVVAVDGGGIQAAAWAATVLTGIEQRWPEFSRSTRFISSISGGSVGSMYFLSALRPDRAPTDVELSAVVAAASHGSLSEAAWGFAYPDLWRAIVPIVFYRFEKDRGWAMEQAWRRSLALDPIPTMGGWLAGVQEGWRPAMAFNATTVEDGQRFAFATFAPPASWRLGTVTGRYPGHDIEVPTAARMSATFPYVSPIAAALPGPGIEAWHYADGGYYDNTGMGIAMRWLDAAMLGHEDAFKDTAVAFIRIRSFPLPTAPHPKERAWAYDLIGPVAALLAVRTAAQRERAETELDILQRAWCDRHVAIRKFEFAFELPLANPVLAMASGASEDPRMKSPPLSWQLTPGEQADLTSAWARPGNRSELDRYLALKDAPGAGSCQAPAAAPAGVR
jgi:hypothetical protein